MFTLLLVLVLLLALYIDTAAAAASASSMDAALDSFYPDSEGLLEGALDMLAPGICSWCSRYGVELCTCFNNLPMPVPTDDYEITAEDLLNHEEWPGNSVPQVSPPAVNPADLQKFVPHLPPEQLSDTRLKKLNEEATVVGTGTVQAHLEDTYTPGDNFRRRMQARENGFACSVGGCGQRFNRACDQARHERKHLTHGDRPHQCSECARGFLYPKDLRRHEKTHGLSPSQQKHMCEVAGCGKGFPRRDNLLRHMRKLHNYRR
ncbi:hypothetical protein BS50DRAFT_632646 [Corynespora cassiicola Philippines]|uniref:C2H2 type master regulator of conidiophore development brlA n=1 Tax=Corynespora cassiicola Philippines TaxID=1448308 RepID=A0A2T2NTQ0_CORCC|nr:hypothetical protein BS50DRAFT_632646 [Corynespora cassiicola Philippines]